MKARVIETGEIVEVNQCSILYDDGRRELMYGKELEEVEGTPDYWEKLKHQAAIAAMQGIAKRAYNAYCDDCACYYDMIFEDAKALLKDHAEAVADVCVEFATALVEKLKGK